MKKFCFESMIPHRHVLIKISLMSRFCILFLLAGMLTVFAKDSYAQKVRISLEMSNTPLGKVINEIKNQTEFEFAYDSDLESITFKKVSIKASDENIEQVMNSVLAGTGVTYRVIDRIILLSKNEMITTASAARQGITIRGVVTDESGEPMPGVNVLVKGTTSGVVTGVDGRYSIGGLSNGNVLVFSFIGYAVQEVIVDGQQTVNITLVESSQEIEEVVVTALGIRREEKALGYAVQKVSGNTLQTVKGVDVGTSLTGKVSGLLVKNETDFMAAPSIQIRGESPLIVVDGVAYENVTLREIPSDDIESISVLKGATASALYGFRGSNGAIMITTKSGAKKRGLTVSVNSSTMFNAGFLAIPEQQSMYGRVIMTGNTYDRGANGSWGVPMDGREVIQWDPVSKSLQPMPYLPVGKDNFKNFLEPGFVLNNNVSVTQQGEYGNFRASATWVDNKGQYPNSKYDRITYSISGEMKSNRFSLASNFSYNKNISPNMGSNSYRGYDPMYGLLIWGSPDFDVRRYKDYWLVENESQNNSYTGGANNPYFDRYQRRNPYNKDVFNGMVSMNYEIMPWLKATLRSGFDSYSTKQEAIVSKGSNTGMGTLQLIPGGTEIWGESAKGSYNLGISRGYSLNNDFLLTGNKTIQDFTIDAMVGGTIYYMQNEGIEARTQGGLTIPAFYSLKASVNKVEALSNKYRRQVNSVYGRLALAWRSMVYVDATLRNDWSSTLPESTRSYLYPSVAGSFIVSEALPQTDWLSMWKLRGSWTRSKTPAGIYDINNTFSVTSNAWGTLSSATFPTTVRGTDVLPQSFDSFEAGTFISFFQNRISVDAAYYTKRGYDYLKSADISPSSGFSKKQLNTDEEQIRKGYELTINVTPVKSYDWQWDISFNWSHYERTFKKVDELYTTDATRDWVYDGARVDAYVYYDYQRDETGNIIHNSSGLPQFYPFTSLHGYADPDGVWGVNTNLRFKNWSFGMSVDGRIGGMTPSVTETYMWNSGNHPKSLTEERYLDATQGGANYLSKGVKIKSGEAKWDAAGNLISDTRVLEPNDTKITYKQYIQTVHRSAVWDNWNGGYRPLDQYSTTFFKLREISLTYNVPDQVSNYIRAHNVSISFIAQNVFLWAKDFKYSDPDGGSENFSDPSIRYLGFNLKLDF